MSTYYYLVCLDHEETCRGCSRSMGGVGHLGDSDLVLPFFIFAHRDCNIRILSEHDARVHEYHRWGKETLAAMCGLYEIPYHGTETIDGTCTTVNENRKQLIHKL